jgi:hypothetical protein
MWKNSGGAMLKDTDKTMWKDTGGKC